MFGVAVFMWSYNQLQAYQTTFGQTCQGLNNETQASYNGLQMLQMQMIGVMLAIAGLGALIFGAAKK